MRKKPQCHIVILLSILFLTSPVWAQSELSRTDVQAAPELYDDVARVKAAPVELKPSFKALHEAIDRVVSPNEVGSTKVGILAVDVNSGETLYARNADTLLNPASNVKLVTAAAVLDLLGPGYTFSTTLYATDIKDGAIQQDLYVKGDGEAFLLFSDVMGWVAKLHQRGVRRIEGDIVIDDSIFDGGYLPPGYEQKDADASYRSPIGAVSVNFNAITAVIQPASGVGQAPQIRLDPPNRYIEVVNQATTARGQRSRVQVSALSDGERTRVMVAGSIGQNASPVSVRKRIDHPPLFAGAVLESALEMVGIEFQGTVRTGQTPPEATVLIVHHSQPLSAIVSAMNKWSNNFMAEQLFRVLGTRNGEPSTWPSAHAEVVAFLKRAGFSENDFRLHNGSGLYEGNAFSPRQLVQLLKFMLTHPYGPEFLASLPIAGVDGTLQTRLQEDDVKGVVRGKTGTLNEVCSLSGYLRTQSGRHVAYSIIFNDTPTRAWNYRDHQDRIVRELVRFDD